MGQTILKTIGDGVNFDFFNLLYVFI
jgi:hypothetical protein